MDILQLVDELYEVFADKIGDPLSEGARDLPRALRLAPARVPWSQVFLHEVTLGAPALFAEGMTGVSKGDVRDAVLAHSLAVIDAFGTDRIEDEQIEANPTVYAVLGQARRERNRALMRVLRGVSLASCNFEATDLLSVRAIRRERQVLRASRPVEFEEYERASLDKQGVGIVASVALARAAGWDDRRCRGVQAALEGVWLGLQMGDDVVDWEDDMKNGGAWAVCLMMAVDGRPIPANHLHAKAEIQRRVLDSGVLRRMLAGALRHMRAARRRSAALGAWRLSAWALGQERRLENLVAAECRSPGYAVRAHVLAAWAGEVLA